jgi:hypothetical protein
MPAHKEEILKPAENSDEFVFHVRAAFLAFKKRFLRKGGGKCLRALIVTSGHPEYGRWSKKTTNVAVQDSLMNLISSSMRKS